MSKRNHSSRNTTQTTNASSEAAVPGNSHRPRSKIGQFLKKLKEDAKMLRTNSRSPGSAPENVVHDERASSNPNIEGQAGPSSVTPEPDIQLALRDAQEYTKHMHSLPRRAITVASAGQDAEKDLDTADQFEDTYLKPLKIFDAVIAEIANIHPYAKMALGVLSCAAKESFVQIVLAQADRDKAVLKLVDKLYARPNLVDAHYPWTDFSADPRMRSIHSKVFEDQELL
ncbi:uncharacterized protein EDB93DRAFT_1338684 [Suillus bovinus]|uniref:uncharacterized protein n=1 Tax=Suillus bovinus TaxID=48563 RepID=UPI001B878322|nr:uncharacterized protein EDB93DRAFT_1338684 [Suillus bovinus]KAG2141193.1 hypothetical protein EDB93DRAFT_1338684 [Suillus bovinus]